MKNVILCYCFWIKRNVLYLYYKERGEGMSQEKKNRFIRLAVFSLLAGVAVLLLYFLYRLTGLGFKCPVYELTGFKCPGCGNTRAVTELLKGELLSALKMNCVFPLEFFYIGWVYLFSSREYILKGRFNYIAPAKAFDIAVLVVIVLWVPVRNALGV